MYLDAIADLDPTVTLPDGLLATVRERLVDGDSEAAGRAIPGGADTFLKLLGAAASPCALVALGLFLGEKSKGGAAGKTSMLVIAKLIAQPLLTWWLAFHVFALPLLWAKTAVMLSALPTGTGPFMLAEFYRREAGVTSSTILFSTLISLVTVTLCLAAITH